MHFENALPQTCRDMGVEIRVGTLVMSVGGPLRRAVGFAALPAEAPPAFSLGERGTVLKRSVPLAVRYRVAGLLNGYARTAWFQALGGRRP